MGLTYGGVFENWEIAVAKKLVDQFKRKWKCFSKDDFDDLLQECLSHWYFVRKKYEVSKGKKDVLFSAGVCGLRIGLKNYLDKERQEHNIGTYVTWFIKTSIENVLGIDNEDTKVWRKEI